MVGRSGVRWLALAIVLALLTGCAGVGPAGSSEPQLPRGGRTLFPTYRLFGWVGYPGATALGRLGTGDLDARVTELEDASKEYAAGRQILPVMELIAVTAHGQPGPDGLYRSRASDQVIQTWLDMARKHKTLLLLNIQPGQADFLDELKYFEKWLSEPDVGVALDPEWAVAPGQVPGKQFGSVTGAELDACATWLSNLVVAKKLPEKAFVYHQLHPNIVVKERSLVAEHPGIVLIKSVDGIGSPALKKATYKQLVPTTPAYVHLGFKLFFDEDTRKNTPLMTATEVLALDPQPEYILFE